MAASSGSLTSDGPNRMPRWSRTRENIRAAARAAHVSMAGVQQQGMKRRRRSHKSRPGVSAAAAARRKSVQQSNVRIWKPVEVEELSKLVLGFKLKNGRLPAAMDADFWTACFGCFRDRFTHQQLRYKLSNLKERYRKISCGHAKLIKLVEREVFGIWCLIMEPPSATSPVHDDQPSHVHADEAAPATDNHIVSPTRSTPAVQRNDENIAPTNPSQQFVGDAAEVQHAAALSSQSGEAQPVQAGADHLQSNGNGVDHQHEKRGVAAGVADENGASLDDTGGDGVDEAAASTCSSGSRMPASCNRQGQKRSNSDHAAGYGHAQYTNYAHDFHQYAPFNEGVEHVQRRSPRHYNTVAELAATTKVLAEATLSNATTTSILANTAQTLAQVLVSYGRAPSAM